MIKGYEHLGDVRPVDLIAKLSHVNFNSVMRVAIAMQALKNIYGIELEDIAPASRAVKVVKQPSEDNADGCENAYDGVIDSREGAIAIEWIKRYRKGAGYNAA